MQINKNELPLHLKQFTAEQDYSIYTPMDHASWRYIMRVSREFFKEHAHPKYLEGLRETGVTTDCIPRISEMDQKLQKFGWRAVIVTGFIPPEPFLEMLAHRILPIASDMRKLENLDYTPAPDIVHEAAGHAPILADEDYSSYLKKFGEIARKVIFAKEDNDLYEAVLNLSETKENPDASAAEIEKAQIQLDKAVENVGYVSEAQKITRLGWWTIEYGLFEKDGKYLIYGAGLLSSVSESYDCLSDKVRKVPLTVDCVNTSYDITKPQPQLFVTDDFKKLEKVIDELSEMMSYKKGGIEALKTAQRAQTLTTTVMDSGTEVSGILTDYKTDSKGRLSFLKFSGPTQISLAGVQLDGQGPSYHKEGFSSPVGPILGLNQNPSLAEPKDWQVINCIEGKIAKINFESGITLEGLWASSLRKNQKTIVMTFKDCTIKDVEGKLLYQPEWGPFDLIFGDSVVSVYGGASDRDSYSKAVYIKEYKPRAQKNNLTPENSELSKLYGIIRSMREVGNADGESLDRILRVNSRLDESYPEDWLLRLEILELLTRLDLRSSVRDELTVKLLEFAAQSDRMEMLIRRGFALIEKPEQ